MIGIAVLQCAGDQILNILNQGAAQRHAQNLDAPADCHQRLVALDGPMYQVDFQRVTRIIRDFRPRMWGLTIPRRIHVIAARQQNPVKALKDRLIGGLVKQRRHDQRRGPGCRQRPHIRLVQCIARAGFLRQYFLPTWNSNQWFLLIRFLFVEPV